MKPLAAALAALSVAVLLGQLLTDDPGVVMIGYRGTLVRTSLVVFVLLAALALAVLYVAFRVLIRLLTLRGRVGQWSAERRRRRAGQGLIQGLLALAEGEYARAERLLARSAEGDAPAVHYLAAAEAAQAQQASARRDTYLRLASETAPEAALAVALRRARFALDDGDLAGAEQQVAALAATHGDHREVFVLRHRLCLATSNWAGLRALLPALRRQRVYPETRLRALEAETASRLLAAPAPDLGEVRRLWNGLPKSTRAETAVLDRYAADLMAAGAPDEAETLLRKAIEHQWNERLVARYGELVTSEPARTVATAERWRARRPRDPTLLQAVGRLCLRAELWGKARGYLEEAAACAPSPLVMQLLAQAYERLGERDTALRHRETGLALAVKGAPS